MCTRNIKLHLLLVSVHPLQQKEYKRDVARRICQHPPILPNYHVYFMTAEPNNAHEAIWPMPPSPDQACYDYHPTPPLSLEY